MFNSVIRGSSTVSTIELGQSDVCVISLAKQGFLGVSIRRETRIQRTITKLLARDFRLPNEAWLT